VLNQDLKVQVSSLKTFLLFFKISVSNHVTKKIFMDIKKQNNNNNNNKLPNLFAKEAKMQIN